MSDEIHTNLPADFDDLSVHAPQLALIARGSDFVAPEDYFETLPEQVLALVDIPKTDGFIFPEQETTNLISLVEHQLEFPTHDGFSVDEQYFEQFANEITGIVSLADLKENSNAAVTLPDDYFENLPSVVETHLILDNLKPDDGFTLPNGYFEQFSSTIQKNIASDELSLGSDADVPAGYFETLPDKIFSKLDSVQSTGRVIPLRSSWIPRAVAAGIALLLVSGAFFVFKTIPGNETQSGKLLSSSNFPVQFPKVLPKNDKQQDDSPIIVQKDVTKQLPVPTLPSPLPEVESENLSTIDLGIELVDEQTIVEYASERLGGYQDDFEDSNEDVNSYIDNVDLEDILPIRPGTKK